ncbi:MULTISPECIES: hypothetical protein [unclassified Rhodanobacter]|uniref:hypothetical protein n=1 Tax=unclassified Rhodanobacter TaxID=2621553 RepID=UPI001BDFD05F|nr:MULTISPECIES: hypothetical protein [unclassified Rhodanobacter]MBT2144792.1 hypothetical protein [Rhodanobacter sp. LX-99]MBT2148837.1 hypothetical protein [Rhodanobacter sp. LX-100]
MSDTIELLETIGRDASLRHAPTDELAIRLERADASRALRTAVASGDSAWLLEEFGHKPMYAPQISQAPGFEEEAPEEGESEEPELPAEPERSK